MLPLLIFTAAAVAQEHSANHAPVAEQTVDFDSAAAYAASQDAIGNKLSNHLFVDSNAVAVETADFLGQPLVISMIYTSCHHICPTLTTHLSDVVDIAEEALGEGAFTVLTVGFDTEFDTPNQLAMFAAQRGIDSTRWHFLSTDAHTVKELADELGFLYRRSPRGFDHMTQTTVTDASGTITNQIYGTNFDPPLLVEALKHLMRGEVFAQSTVAGWWREIKLLCTVYDPSTGRYHFDYSLIVALIMGFACLLAVAVFIVRAWRSSHQITAKT